MKCVICTGITGSERRDYLEELRHSMKETDRFHIEDPWLRTKKLHSHLDEKTILNISDKQRLGVVRSLHRRKTLIHGIRPVLLVTILLVSAVLPMVGCSSDADKGNPNLSGHLKRLIEAEERGEAEEFARQRSIELIDGSVTVIIECEPGQAEAVAEAATKAGAEQVMSYNGRRDLVQAVVPITSLTALADIAGVRFVRLPWYPEENEEEG